MHIGVPLETHSGETRVAATPETVKKLIGQGHRVTLQSGAGLLSSVPDSAYEAVGATIGDAAAAFAAELVLKVNAPDDAELAQMQSGSVLLGMLNPFDNDCIARMATRGITAFALEAAPRTSRAQSLDVLSSQANIAGYKAVLVGAHHYPRFMPMLMTAAGTVKAARVLILGAGVAGLQAIATAKRLGAVVTATDVRPETKEQVESLGGKFLEVDAEMEKDAQTEGGYAKEMPPEYFEKQKQVVAEHIKKQDVVITTALVPGRPAPVLINDAMVASMRDGAVIVDLATEAGGNCTLSEPGKVVKMNGVTIIGHANMPGRLAEDASSLYAKNLINFLTPLIDAETKQMAIDWEDEIIQGTLVCRDGQVVHPALSKGD